MNLSWLFNLISSFIIISSNLKAFMILEQNYIKIAQYTQKSFKLYSRRSLANILLNKLNQNHKKLQFSKYENSNPNFTSNNDSELNASKQEINQEYYKTAKQIDNQNDQYFSQNIDYEHLYYGDVVVIEIYNEQLNFNSTENKQRVYAQLDQLKYNSLDNLSNHFDKSVNKHFEVDVVMLRKCSFQLINPYDTNAKTLINSRSLVVFKNIFYGNYVTLTDKAVKDLFFGYQIILTEEITKRSLASFFSTTNNEELLTYQPIGIKFFDKFVRAQNQRVNGNNDGSVFYFLKISKKQKLFPNFYRIKNIFLNQYVTSSQIQIAKLMTRKTFTNVLIQDQNLEITKINQLSIAQIDFDKIFQSQIFFDNQNCESIQQVWQFKKIIQDELETLNQYHLYHLSQKKGATIKSDKIIKLTSNQKQYSKFSFGKQNSSQNNQQLFQIINESTNSNLTIIRNKDQTCKFNLSLSQSQSQNNYKIQQNKKTQYIFQKISQQQSFLIMELLDIQKIVKKIYLFFQNWGFVYQQKNQVIKFSVQEIKIKKIDLQNSLIQMKKIMIKLKLMILSNCQTEKKIKNIIRELKIFQILIYLAKIIMLKIIKKKDFPKQNINDNNFKSIILTSEKDLSKNQQIMNPFSLSKDLLQQFFLQLFDLFFIFIKNCQGSSTTVINQAGFFNKLLIFYPQQIGRILKQSIKNLSLFTTKHSSEHSQLFQWIKLIQPLKSQTVLIQKTYIDIIAEVVVDPNDVGIIPYQNKCKQLLYNQRNKKKGLPRFSIQSQRPAIILDSNINQFLNQNLALSYLEIAFAQTASFYIEDFYHQRNLWKQREQIQHYAKYTISLIRLMRNMCKDRNKKLLKIAQDNGLTKAHIKLCLSNAIKIGWRLKFQYLSLYSCIYIDQQPLLCFSKRQQKCHIWASICHYDLTAKTAFIFNQYTDKHSAQQKYKQFDSHVICFIQQFINQSQLINEKTQVSKIHQKCSQKHNKKKQIQHVQRCQCFFILMRVIYESMNFGYFSLKFIKRYIIFGINQFNSLFCSQLFIYQHSQQHVLLLHNVLSLILDIIRLAEDILVGIHSINLLKIFHKKIQSNQEFFTTQNLQQYCIKVLNNDIILADIKIKSQQVAKIQKQEANCKEVVLKTQQKKPVAQIQKKNATCKEVTPKIQQKPVAQIQKKNATCKEVTPKIQQKPVAQIQKKKPSCKEADLKKNIINEIENKQFDIQVGTFIFNLNLVHFPEYKKKIYSKILQISNNRFNRGQNISNRFKQFLILEGPKQEVLYQDYSGRNVGKWITIIKLQDLVNKIKISEQQMTDDRQDQKRKKEKIIELNNLLTKIIKQIKNYKEQNLNLAYKFQKMLQKLNLHTILLELFEFSQKTIYYDMISSIYMFLLEFIQNNQQNKTKIEGYFPIFFKNLKIPKSAELISQLFWTNNYEDKFQFIFNQLCLTHQEDARQNILQAIFKILKLDTKNKLKHRKAQMALSMLKNNNIESISKYSAISVQYTNLLCQISQNCDFIGMKVRNVYSKTLLRSLLYQKNEYPQKTMYMKIYYHFYLRCLTIQDNQIQSIFKNLILPELRHLPSVCQYFALQKIRLPENKLNQDKITQIKQKYQKLIVYDQSVISPSQQQKYWNFLFNSSDQNQMSLVNFTINLLSLNFNKRKSKCYQQLISYLKQLCVFLNMIFSGNNEKYQKKMLNKLQQILIKHDQQTTNKKIKYYFELSEADKQFLKGFFNNFSKLIILQKVSFYKISNCAKINIDLLNRKRAGQFIQKLILQSEFIQFFRSLGDIIKNQNQYIKLVSQSIISQLFNIYRCKTIRKINIYKFVQKIIQTLEFMKSTSIMTFHQDLQKFQRKNTQELKQVKKKELKQVKKRHDFKPNNLTKLIHFDRYVDSISKCFSQSLNSFIINRYKARFNTSHQQQSIQQIINWSKINSNILKVHLKFINCKVLHTLIFKLLLKINQNNILLQVEANVLNLYLQNLKSIIKNGKMQTHMNIFMQFFNNFSKFNSRQNCQMMLNFIVNQFYKLYEDCILNKCLLEKEETSDINEKFRYSSYFLQYIQIIKQCLASSSILTINLQQKLEKDISLILIDWAKYSKPQNNAMWVQIIQKLVNILICNIQDCQIAANLISNNQIFRLKLITLAQSVLNNFFNSNLESDISSKTLSMFIKFIFKINLKSYKEQVCRLLNQFNFSLMSKTFERGINNFQIMKSQAKLQIKCQQYMFNMTCSQNICNQLKSTPFVQKQMQLIFNLMIILQISIRHYREGSFAKKPKQQNIKALVQYDELTNQTTSSVKLLQLKKFNRYISFITYYSQKNVLMNFQFQVPKISFYLNNFIKKDIINKINQVQVQQVYKCLNQFSYYLQASLENQKLYSKLFIIKLFVQNQQVISILLLVMNFLITFSIIVKVEIPTFILFGCSSLFILAKLFWIVIIYRKIKNIILHLKEQQLSLRQKLDIIKVQGLGHNILSVFFYLWTFISYQMFAFTCFFQLSNSLISQLKTRLKNFGYLGLGLLIIVIGYVLSLFYIGIYKVYFGKQITPTDIVQMLFEIYQFCFTGKKITGKQYTLYLQIGDKLVLLIFCITLICFFCYTVSKIILTLITQEKYKKSKYKQCFICLKSNEELIKQGNSFVNHVKFQHSLWSYLYFFISLRANCGSDSVDYYVKNSIQNNKYQFVKLW